MAASHSPESCVLLSLEMAQHWCPDGWRIVDNRGTDSLIGVKKDLLGTTPATSSQLFDGIVALTNLPANGVGVVGK